MISPTRVLAIGLLLAALAPTAGTQIDPRTLPLLPPSVFSGLATSSFRFDWSDGAGGNLAYGGGALGVSEDGNYLYISCQQDDHGIAKLEIPPGGGMARVVAPCVGPDRAEIARIHPDPTAFRPMLGGVLEQNGRMVVTGYISYDANGGTTASHWGGPSLSALSGPYAGTVSPGMVKSQMGPVPHEWRPLLGGPALSSAGYTSIISRASYGASVSVFDPADVGAQNPIPMTMLLGCPHSVPSCITYGTPTSNNYNGSELSGGFFIVPGTRTLAVIEREASGPTCYGYATRNAAEHGLPYPSPEGVVWCYSLSDPLNQKGPKGYPYRLVAKLYDLSELVEVRLGRKRPWDIRQYATVDLPGSSAGEFVTSGAFNYVRNEYYLLRYVGGGVNTVHVYKVAGASGGGGGGGGGGVPGAPVGFQGVVSGSTLSLSWQAPASGAANYVVDAGSVPGGSDVAAGLSLGNVSSFVATGIPPGTYYLRLRAIGAGGASSVPSSELRIVVGGSGGGGGGGEGGGDPVVIPGPPDGFRATVTGPGSVLFVWHHPEDGSPVTGYYMEAGSQPGLSDLAPPFPLPVSLSFGVTGVPPGVYYVRLRGANSAGIGAPSGDRRVVVP
jgi:hypothetical protein